MSNKIYPTNSTKVTRRCNYTYTGRDGVEKVCGRKAAYRRQGCTGGFLHYCERHRDVAEGKKPENFTPAPNSELVVL